MGMKDIISKKYFRNNRRFSDLFNYFLFEGEPVIDPEALSELDPVELLSAEPDAKDKNGQRNRKQTAQRILDLKREAIIRKDKNTIYVLLGLENESNIRYDMPVRIILSDALEYSDQVNRLRQIHHESKDLTSDEFVSGISKQDRLKKVITLVLYLSSEPWTGPRCLHDMLEKDDLGLDVYVPDYRLNLIIPNEITDFSRFRSELGKLLEFMKAGKSKETLTRLLKEKPEYYSDMDLETAQMIEEFTKVTFAGKGRGQDTTDMCRGIIELQEESRAQGVNVTLDILDRRQRFPDESYEETAKALGCTEKEVRYVVMRSKRIWKNK